MRRRGLVLVLAAGLVATACGSRGGSSSTSTTSPVGGGGGSSSSNGNTSSDVGITPDQVSISSLIDTGGPVPGLFETSKDAMAAFVAYINSQGGVNGRRLKLTTFDTQISPTTFQIDTTQSCQNDFAVVGSYSIGDNGGVSVGQQCGIPEVPAAITAPQAGAATNVISPLPTQPNQFSTGFYDYMAHAYPSAVKKAGILYPDNPVTKVAAERVVGTAQSVGYHFLYDQVVSLIQVDFTSFVLAMKNLGVQYLSWGADYQAMGRLLQAAQQQNWHPQVLEGSATGYSQAFLRQSGSLANGMIISLPIALFEDRSTVPMMQTYLTWLDRAVPGHVPPDIFGVLSWSSGLLFVKALQEAGQNPTRAKVLQILRGIHSWNGDGLQGTSDPGNKVTTTCFVAVQIRGGAFVRLHPTQAGTFDCSGHLYTVPGIPPASQGGGA